MLMPRSYVNPLFFTSAIPLAVDELQHLQPDTDGGVLVHPNDGETLLEKLHGTVSAVDSRHKTRPEMKGPKALQTDHADCQTSIKLSLPMWRDRGLRWHTAIPREWSNAMNDKFLKLAEVLEYLSISKSTVYAAMQTNEFPRSTKLSTRSVRWRQSEIEKWLRSRGDQDGES
jgi:prophage regulatory protein